MNKREVKMLEFPQRGDKRGHLVIVEGMKDVPFDIKRIFYIYGSDKDVVILSILVDTFISKISLTMQPGPKIDSISGA